MGQQTWKRNRKTGKFSLSCSSLASAITWPHTFEIFFFNVFIYFAEVNRGDTDCVSITVFGKNNSKISKVQLGFAWREAHEP